MTLLEYVQSCVDKFCGWVNFNVIEICFNDGFWSWRHTVDAEGNIVDSVKTITSHDLQEFCNCYGVIDSNGNIIDCLNY